MCDVIYLVIKAVGEYEDYKETPIEAWTSREDAEKSASKYNENPNVIPEEDWDRLCEEVDEYKLAIDETKFSTYIEGILFLHKDYDTPEFVEKLENSEDYYSNWGHPNYFVYPVNFMK